MSANMVGGATGQDPWQAAAAAQRDPVPEGFEAIGSPRGATLEAAAPAQGGAPMTLTTDQIAALMNTLHLHPTPRAGNEDELRRA